MHGGADERPPLPHLTGIILKGCRAIGAGMLDTVRELLTGDADPMVVSNCMSVIQKVAPLLSQCMRARRAQAGPAEADFACILSRTQVHHRD